MVALLVIRQKFRFRKRPEVPLCDWLGSIGFRSTRGVTVCEKVLKALGDQFGISPLRFRPEDSFDRELAWAPPWVGLSNPALKDFLGDVSRILWEEDVRNWHHFKYRKKCLRDLLLEIDAVLVESESGGARRTGQSDTKDDNSPQT
jgi:hypothetical protein